MVKATPNIYKNSQFNALERVSKMAVQVGSPAPKFSAQAYLRSADKFQEISLDDYKGKWLCLYFYPMDFTFVCPTEIQAFDNAVGEFQSRNCELLTCSTDSHFVHRGWCEASDELKQLKHPMLADITKRISMDYGLLLPRERRCSSRDVLDRS